MASISGVSLELRVSGRKPRSSKSLVETLGEVGGRRGSPEVWLKLLNRLTRLFIDDGDSGRQ